MLAVGASARIASAGRCKSRSSEDELLVRVCAGQMQTVPPRLQVGLTCELDLSVDVSEGVFPLAQ